MEPKPGQFDAHKPRTYDPEKPNIYYKGDPASDEAMMRRAVAVSYNESFPEKSAVISGSYPRDGEQTVADVRKNAERILSGGPGGSAMTVEQATKEAEAGNPIFGDASVARYSDAFGNYSPYDDDDGLGSMHGALRGIGGAEDDVYQSGKDIEEADEAVRTAQENLEGAKWQHELDKKTVDDKKEKARLVRERRD